MTDPESKPFLTAASAGPFYGSSGTNYPLVFGAPLPNVYFNGFNLNLTNADSNLVLLLDGQPQIKLSMSFTTAKTLTAFMTEMIQKLEAATGRNIMKVDEVDAGLKKLQEADQKK